ncbi:hypothetical protein IJG44_00985 [bacterium]|nr:hypothetical protein [bacterium]MBQ4438146.1 hypothetical protein [bacterium]
MIKLVIFLVFSAIFCSCASEPAAKDGQPSSARTSAAAKEMKERYKLTSKGDEIRFDGNVYEIKQYDINKDKKPDILNVFKKVPNEKGGNDLLISVKMMDLNHDSRIDVWRYFNEETGAVVKEELDLDFDNKVDRIDYFIGGLVVRSEFDFQFDEKADIIKSYDELGQIIAVESDQNGDGVIDYWEYYKNGVIEKIEKDTDKDGKPDVSKMPGDDDFKSIAPVDEKLEAKPAENVQEKPEDEIKVEIETSEEPEPAAAQPAKEEPKQEEAKPAEESK